MKTGKALLIVPLIFFILLQVTLLAALGLTSIAQSTSPAYAAKPNIADLSTILVPLVNQSDMIVRGQVVQSNSRWNQDHTLIETNHQLAVHYTLLGKSTPEVVIHTDGGFLPAEGLGMLTSHSASFAVGEEVLIFLQKSATGYRVVGGEAGKFSVVKQEAVSDYYSQPATLDQIIPQILTVATSQGRQTSVASNWRSAEPITTERTINAPNQPWVDPKWPGTAPKIKVKVNLNSSHIGEQGGSADLFLTAIKNALRTWSVVGEAELTLLYDGDTTATSTGFNTKNEILFMPKGAGSQVGQAQVWFTSSGAIVEADIWLNDDYQLDATGAPQGTEIDLESVTLHEVGHWLPLGHTTNPNDMMYPVLGAGQRRINLSSDDSSRLAALYPCTAVPCIDPAYGGNGTPQATATDTPTPNATASATATSIANPNSTAVATATATPNAPASATTTATPTLATAPTITGTPTLVPSAVTPTPGGNIFLPLVRR
jgi:Matrixin